MSDTITLIKTNPLLPAEDYEALRKQGFKAIERLGSALWTDYNNSDPGITILEAVCYAITDLAYRTGFEIKDLLAPEEREDDTWKQIFYTARQILHNNPLTLNDYRKLIIDIKGVRNAWIEPSKDYEAPLWVDFDTWEVRENHACTCADAVNHICIGRLFLGSGNDSSSDAQQQKLAELQEKLNNPDDTDLKTISPAEREQFKAFFKSFSGNAPSPKILELEGLYNVIIEYEEDVIDENLRDAVRQAVFNRLARHRNLCEDFLGITAVDYEDFGIGAAIELEEYADPDVVLAEIFFTLYQYFTPSIPFHTIDQMLAKGYAVDEIFEGPALKHGFIDTAELEKTDLFRDLRLSDIINAISDIKGIKGILYLHLPFAGFSDESSAKQFFSTWVDGLRAERKIARVQPEMSQVLFCKERDFISYYLGRPEDRNPKAMLRLFKNMKSIERKYKLEGCTLDFPVPVGEYMQIEDYFPVTESLPMCYGVSTRSGLPPETDAKRRAQVLQLKGYLLFFEQILAGYLVQLNHLRDLFSFDSAVKHTYFSRVLDELDQLQALLIDYEKSDTDDFAHTQKVFAHLLQDLIESPEVFGGRRNRFLDHLLARFAEDISEYSRISRWLTPDKIDARLIANKANLLQDGEYYQISSARGRGYDYSASDYWDCSNVSGGERRISRLLGFDDINRRTLAPEVLVTETLMEIDAKTKQQTPKTNAKGQVLNIIKLLDPDDHEQVLLTSVEVADGCCTEALMTAMLQAAGEHDKFQPKEHLKLRSRRSAGLLGTFWFELWDGADPSNSTLLASSEHFDNKQQRDHVLHRVWSIIDIIDRNEGWHLVEHLLLRPRFDEVFDEADNRVPFIPLDICLDVCDLSRDYDTGEAPTYQKRIRRISAEKCYDQMPWILEYSRAGNNGGQSLLFQIVPADNSDPTELKFRSYEQLMQRVRDLHEFGSERRNYEIVSNQEETPKYGFIIHGPQGSIVAQSRYAYSKKSKKSSNDSVEHEIEKLMRYFEFELDLYCTADPCDYNEDPYSFRTTAILPCWPKRFRDATFRNLVEKTIRSELPAHVHPRIIWVGIQEMQRFEKVYRDWLLEMSQTELPSFEKTNPLVNVLNSLRPCGVCHDDCG